jgi:hypothetical protein
VLLAQPVDDGKRVTARSGQGKRRSVHDHPESECRRLLWTSLPPTVRWSSEGQVMQKEASGKEKELVEESVVEEDAAAGKYAIASSHCRLRRGELERRGCEILQTATRCGQIWTAMTCDAHALRAGGCGMAALRTGGGVLWCAGLVLVAWRRCGRAAACCGVQGVGCRVHGCQGLSELYEGVRCE